MPFDPNVELEDWQLVLLRAAQIVRERWTQHKLGTDGEPRCAIGAIKEAGGGLNATEHLGRTRTITAWNDAPGRTAEEVASEMEACALEGVKNAIRSERRA